MANKVLDNPIWNAMISGNSNLTTGNGYAKFFPEDVGPFAGLKKYDEPSFQLLYDIFPKERVAVIFSANPLSIPSYWKLIESVDALQMIFTGKKKPLLNYDEDIVMLNEQHVSQMIDLTSITHPGPFLNRTIEFGNYFGILKGDKLIAMAGQRLHPGKHIEISAVCTHPDHTGKGYGKALINSQVDKIISEDNIPILHVKANNEHAINLYKHLGFSVRSEMNIKVIQKQD
jgi:ribosomal protein S18 acetylase RimI-like enzyme